MIIDNTEYIVNPVDLVCLIQADLHEHDIQLLEKEPRESGNNIQIQCPYHGNGQERKPSAGIRKTDGIFHCFACGETHTLPEVISFCFGHEDNGHYGKIWLNQHIEDKFYVYNKKESVKINTDKKNKYDKLGNLYDADYVSEQELDDYRWTHPYWTERGITDDSIIELFDLGYDKQTDCITFPVRDRNGNCEFIARRSVRTKFFQYPPNVTKPLYGLYELYHSTIISGSRRSPSILLCESMIDCILLWQSKHPALALNGLGNDRQFIQLRNLDVKYIVLATDNDEAGKEARKRIRKNVQNKIFSEIAFPKDIKDIGECSREQIDNILSWEKWG